MTNYMTKIDLPLYASETINFLQLKSSKLQNVLHLSLVKNLYIFTTWKIHADIPLVKTVFNGLESLDPKTREMVRAEKN